MRFDGLAQLIIKSIKLLPPILLVGLVVTYAGLFIFQQYHLMVRGSYLILPIIFLNIVYFMKLKHFKQETDFSNIYINIKPKIFLLFTALFIIFQILGVVAAVINGRSIIYFISIGIGILLIALQILTTRHESKGRNLTIILEITALYLNIVLSQSLTFPLFFGATDPLGHMVHIQSIIDNNNIFSLGYYTEAPLYHILGASNVLITGLSLETSFFLVYTLAFSSTILFVYLFSYKITNNIHISLITTLLYATGEPVIFAGLAVTTRVMGTALVLILLYLLIDWHDITKRAIAISLIVPIVLTHHTTVLHFFMLLILLMIIEIVLMGKTIKFRFGFIILFLSCFLSYWLFVYHFVFQTAIKAIINVSELEILPDITMITKSLSASVFGAFDKSLIAFFSLVGIVFIANTYNNKRALVHVIIVFSIISLLLYLDTPLDFLSYLFLLGRLPLMVSPFVMLAMAFGIYFLLSNKFQNVVFYAIVLIFFSLSSILIQGNYTDLNNSFVGTVNRKYFINSEIAAFNYVADSQERNSPALMVYTDYHAARYLMFIDNIDVTAVVSKWSSVDNSDYYFLLRKEELTDKQQLKFTEYPVGTQRSVGKALTKDYIDSWFSQKALDVVYDNKACEILYCPPLIKTKLIE